MLSPHIIDDMKRKNLSGLSPDGESTFCSPTDVTNGDPGTQMGVSPKAQITSETPVHHESKCGEKMHREWMVLLLGILLVGIAFVFRGGSSRMSMMVRSIQDKHVSQIKVLPFLHLPRPVK